ncbi:MAG: AbrB/MazE/SpoVT family DNA-binding domain-containing protein [Candidatus Woesearchaeota archaeon]
MIEIKTRLRKWGNSFGVVVPQKEAERSGVKEGEEVILFVKKKNEENILKESFGTYRFKRSTDNIIEESDKELDSGL